MKYRIRPADADNIRDAIKVCALHDKIFGETAPQVDPRRGRWWLVLDKEGNAIAFAGVRQANLFRHTGYLKRVGVLPGHRGNGLQNRLLRVREAWCRRSGLTRVVTDTTQNPPSANVLIRRGYKTFIPKKPWSFTDAIYWTKNL